MTGFINAETWEWIIGVSPHTGEPKTETRKLIKIPAIGFDDHGQEMIQYPGGVKSVMRYDARRGKWFVKYQVGSSYPVHPGRGKPAVCHIVIDDVNEESLRDVKRVNARAEGFLHEIHFWDVFFNLNTVHKRLPRHLSTLMTNLMDMGVTDPCAALEHFRDDIRVFAFKFHPEVK